MNNELTPNKEEQTPISSTNTGTNMPVQEGAKASPKEPPEKHLTAAPTKKLDEILPESGTNLLYISGTLAGHDYDCEGPIEFPFKLDKPMWPLTPIQPNPNYKYQRFDYGSGTWIATDAKSQGQQITDLTKQVTKLNQDSVKHDRAAEQSQQMVMQQMQMLTAINTKLDKLTKDGDK
ncbi:hypothetical protein CBF56_00030 [Lactobacillus taiwanensis]|uniref:hypothetical protein n=1 Tax=Lactobacillus taiwanensis TaxID=508451 RepID=UPI000B97CC7B|nr:hypothetical protein [Lactobacillus taiwanensis]OYS20937.1 hypothetical protein CBF56_00030 [Lactobacillus taiwanensis]OYS21035.1 hypothetical protein CBF49_00610 [Lactobacillus taiwanensis]